MYYNYELKRLHSIVDCVGYLIDENRNQWLVFIQISLQRYRTHRKLCDMFRHNVQNASWSIYTYYRQLFSIKYKSTKVLLLYISPRETELPISPDLQSSVKKHKINQQMYVGVLAKDATFYKEMMEFEDMRKN